MTKLDTILWYLKRPPLYHEMGRHILKRLRSDNPKDQTRELAEAWCAERAIDTRTALQKLTGSNTPVRVREKFADIFARAKAKADSCPLDPVEMGGPGNWDLLYGLAEHCNATRIIETGVAYGWSSLSILLSIAARPRAQLISTDMPYPGVNNDAYVGYVVPENLRANWQLIRLPDRDGLPKAIKALGQLDLCHYDSDKTYDGKLWAYPLLWNVIRSRGYFISDDISDNLAFKDFVKSIDLEPTITQWNGKFIGVLTKPGRHVESK